MSKCVNACAAYNLRPIDFMLSVHASVCKVSVVTTNWHIKQSSARSCSDPTSFLLSFPSLSFALLSFYIAHSQFCRSISPRMEFGGVSIVGSRMVQQPERGMDSEMEQGIWQKENRPMGQASNVL